MKKTFKSLLFILLASIGLSACGSSNNNSTINESSNDISSETSSSLNSSLENSNNSADSSFKFDKDTIYDSETWDNNVYEMIAYSVGEVATNIPVCKADSYRTYISSKMTEDMYGNALTVTTTRVLMAELSEVDVENYGALLEKNHFVYSLESDCYYAKASAVDCFYIFFNYFQKTGRLNLEIYRKTLRESEWDDEISEVVIGRKIPHIDCGAYEIYFDNYNIELYVYFVDVTDAQITKYKQDLSNDGWIRTSDTAEFDIYTHRRDNLLKLTLMEGVDSFNDKYLMVRMENAWPYYLANACTGGDLPRSSRGEYTGFFTNEDSQGNYYTQIEYEDCDYDDYVSYCSALKTNFYGYETYAINGSDNPGSYVSSDASMGTVSYSYFAKEYELAKGGIAYVDVLYSSGLRRLIVIIWA